MDNYERSRPVTVGALIKILRSFGVITRNADEDFVLEIVQREIDSTSAKTVPRDKAYETE